MTYQFIHYETYNEEDAKNVINENMRVPGFCPHVFNPKTPAILYGSAEGLGETLKKMRAETKRSVTQKTRSGQIRTYDRAIRDNEHICLFGVISFGREWTEKNPRLSKECIDACIEKLKAKYGDQLKAVIFHDDEEHPHLHFLVVPDDLDISKVCDATAAEKKFDVSKKKDTKKERQEIRLHAMQSYQTEWHREIFGEFGLLKEGPKRRRLTRVEYLAEKETMLDVAKSNQAVRDIKKNLAGVQAGMLTQEIQHEKNINQMNLRANSIQQGLNEAQKAEVAKQIKKEEVLRDVLGF
jgi:Plasmid recombination enzyme